MWSFGDSHYNDYKDSTVICLFNTRNLVRVQMTEHNFNPEPPNTATLKSPLGPYTYRSHPDIPGSFNRSEEHTTELQSLMRISYAVFCLKKTHFNHMRLYHPIHLTLRDQQIYI